MPAAPRRFRHSLALLLLALAGCGATSAAPAATTAPTTAAVEPTLAAAIDVPTEATARHADAEIIASGLQNPRGMHELPDGALLVSEAGTGHAGQPDSRLLKLSDADGDGTFAGPGERSVLLDGMRSANIIEIVRRDEVFGMADIAVGDGKLLVTHAFFGSPTTIYEVRGDEVVQWGAVHANLNGIVFHPDTGKWLAASSSSDELVEMKPGGGQRRILKFPPLSQGQDAVPGYLDYEPRTGAVLVSLFTGSPMGEEGGDGTEIVPRAGMVVRIDPEQGSPTPVITGLTAPTDLVLDARGRVYVLELCDGFADPIESPEDLQRVGHGGFRRFSGRLLRIDLQRGEVLELLAGLDTPTNLTLAGDHLYVATGMGTPGRPIPGPDGAPVPLQGAIWRVALPTD